MKGVSLSHPSKRRTSAEVLHRGHLCFCTCTMTYMKQRGQPLSTIIRFPAAASPELPSSLRWRCASTVMLEDTEDDDDDDDREEYELLEEPDGDEPEGLLSGFGCAFPGSSVLGAAAGPSMRMANKPEADE